MSDIPKRSDDWSIAQHLTNLQVILKAAFEGKATPLDLADAYYQIEQIRRKLGLPVHTTD